MANIYEKFCDEHDREGKIYLSKIPENMRFHAVQKVKDAVERILLSKGLQKSENSFADKNIYFTEIDLHTKAPMFIGLLLTKFSPEELNEILCPSNESELDELVALFAKFWYLQYFGRLT